MTRKSLRELARGKHCQMQLPGHCNHNPETTVLAHIRMNVAGLALKPSDLCAVWACSGCHAAMDGRVKVRFTPDEMATLILGALLRQLTWYDSHEVVTICL